MSRTPPSARPVTRVQLTTAVTSLVAIGATIWLVPVITAPNGPGPDWQLGYALLAGLALVGGLWRMRGSLGSLPAEPDADPEHRRIAHDFPVAMLRGSFGAAVIGACGTIAYEVWAERTIGSAIAVGVITYFVALLPALALYQWTHRLLQRHAAGPPGSGPLGGIRQSVATRLAYAVQVPIILGASGLLMLQLSNAESYNRDVDAYFSDRLTSLAQRVGQALPADQRGAFAEALPDTVRAKIARDPDLAGDALGLGVVPFALLAVLIGTVALIGRRMARTVTADLGAIGHTLRHINDDTPSPPPPSVALAETDQVATALSETLVGLATQREALHRAAAERRRADEAKARFLAHLSHELKSPLNSILGFAELMLAEIDGPLDRRQRTHLGIMWRSGDSLLRFILALLDLARLDGRVRSERPAPPTGGFAPVPTRAADLTRVLRDQVRPDPLGAVDATVRFEADREPGHARAWFDPTQTARALWLIAGSLLDAMDNGEVEFAIDPERDGALWIEVNVISADGEAADRTRLVDVWKGADEAAQAGDGLDASDLRAAPVLLLHRLCKAQGGEAIFLEYAPWPRVALRLPLVAIEG